MMARLRTVRDGMTTVLNVGLMLTVGLLVVDVMWGVITRYIFGEQAKWTEELARFLLIWVSLLGGAVAFGTKGHLGVDYFVGKFDPSARKVLAVVGHLVVLVFAGLVFLYGGGRLVAEALTLEQTTPALGWKMGHVYLALPIAGVFMTIYTVENLVEALTISAEEMEEAERAGEPA